MQSLIREVLPGIDKSDKLWWKSMVFKAELWWWLVKDPAELFKQCLPVWIWINSSRDFILKMHQTWFFLNKCRFYKEGANAFDVDGNYSKSQTNPKSLTSATAVTLWLMSRDSHVTNQCNAQAPHIWSHIITFAWPSWVDPFRLKLNVMHIHKQFINYEVSYIKCCKAIEFIYSWHHITLQTKMAAK